MKCQLLLLYNSEVTAAVLSIRCPRRLFFAIDLNARMAIYGVGAGTGNGRACLGKSLPASMPLSRFAERVLAALKFAS